MSDMVIKLLDDMNKAVDAEYYFAALAIALMLPDICGRAEYGEKARNKERYIQWFDNWVSSEPWIRIDGKQKPQINGTVAYQLRNSFLHQGTADISAKKKESAENGIDEFVLILEPKNESGMYFDSITRAADGHTVYEANIRNLCLRIDTYVRIYYEHNKEKFDFFDHKIRYRHKRSAIHGNK